MKYLKTILLYITYMPHIPRTWRLTFRLVYRSTNFFSS